MHRWQLQTFHLRKHGSLRRGRHRLAQQVTERHDARNAPLSETDAEPVFDLKAESGPGEGIDSEVELGAGFQR